MTRAVPEWIAKHDDQAIPPRVKLRILDREDFRCWISGRKIRPGDAFDFDHKVALVNGGEHRESNLFPALRDKHREKTAQDVAEKAKTARVRKKHLGIAPKGKAIQSRGFSTPSTKYSRARGALVDRETGQPVEAE